MEHGSIYTLSLKHGGQDLVCYATTRPVKLKRDIVYLIHKGKCCYAGTSRREMVRKFREDWNSEETDFMNRQLIGCRIDRFDDGGLNHVF